MKLFHTEQLFNINTKILKLSRVVYLTIDQ